MSHLKTPELDRNAFDTNRRVILAMTVRPAILLLTLLLEDNDFFGAVVLEHCRFHFGVCQQRRTGLELAVVFDDQNFSQMDFGSGISGNSLQPDRLSRS